MKKQYTKEEHAVIKAANKSAKLVEIPSCVQCGHTRFKTNSKEKKVFSCRKCEAVYQGA